MMILREGLNRVEPGLVDYRDRVDAAWIAEFLTATCRDAVFATAR